MANASTPRNRCACKASPPPSSYQPVWWQSNLMVVIDQSGALSFVPRLRDDAYFRRRSPSTASSKAPRHLHRRSRLFCVPRWREVDRQLRPHPRRFNGDCEVVVYDQDLYNLGGGRSRTSPVRPSRSGNASSRRQPLPPEPRTHRFILPQWWPADHSPSRRILQSRRRLPRSEC